MHHLRLGRQLLRPSIVGLVASRSCRTSIGAISTLRAVNYHHQQWPTVTSIQQRQQHTSAIPVDDTIYALSTAPGRAAIAVIRVSGPACLAIYRQLCPNTPLPKPRAATLRKLKSPNDAKKVLDTGALILHFPAPNTVTGEDVLELHVHGGPAIVRSVLEAVTQCQDTRDGRLYIRPAQAGEFTKRAFYNGRVDLTEVEALGEALAAETEQQRRLAISGAASDLTQRYEQWRSMLLYARGELEALIDFSEDQYFDEGTTELLSNVSNQVVGLEAQLKRHILNAGRGELLRSGINVALLGAPNAGKSSLLNRIVGREAAIVSTQEGTTRDIVDVSVDLNGWLVRLGDMAGLRATPAHMQASEPVSTSTIRFKDSTVGEIEREGIRRARERALQSDLVVVLISLQLTPGGYVELAINDELLSAVQECRQADKHLLFAVNKTDLLLEQTAEQKVSISRLLSGLMQVLPDINANDVFCLSCKDSALPSPDEPDAGGLHTFIAGLSRKFSSMTSAAANTSGDMQTPMSPAEAQGYWTASLNVTHRQSQFLQECLVQLENFLEITRPIDDAEAEIYNGHDEAPPGPDSSTTRGHSESAGFFDTSETPPTYNTTRNHGYHIDGHEDLIGKLETVTDTESESRSEICIVRAAEHLRYAADCLAKLTGRGDSSSGADVEDVLGVVFEK